MPAGSHRQVDPLYASCAQDITSFSDGYPILLIGQPALTQLNTKLSEPLPMNRFRPSIVFTGGEPHYEDMIKRFRINEVNFSGVKLCGRCTVTTTDQDTGTRGKEPLKTLATYRSINNKICFGQNVIAHDTGHINVGDEILVK